MLLESAATVVKLPRALHRSIIVEPARGGLWRWVMYRYDGSYAGWRSEEGERAQAVASAQQYSRKIGLPAFYRHNTYAAPQPMRRQGSSR